MGATVTNGASTTTPAAVWAAATWTISGQNRIDPHSVTTGGPTQSGLVGIHGGLLSFAVALLVAVQRCGVHRPPAGAVAASAGAGERCGRLGPVRAGDVSALPARAVIVEVGHSLDRRCVHVMAAHEGSSTAMWEISFQNWLAVRSAWSRSCCSWAAHDDAMASRSAGSWPGTSSRSTRPRP